MVKEIREDKDQKDHRACKDLGAREEDQVIPETQVHRDLQEKTAHQEKRDQTVHQEPLEDKDFPVREDLKVLVAAPVLQELKETPVLEVNLE